VLRSNAQLRLDSPDGLFHGGVNPPEWDALSGVKPLADLSLGGDDRAMAFAADAAANVGQRSPRMLAGQEHDEHARKGDRGRLAAGAQISGFDAQDIADGRNDFG
jgi:hypothetical protein